MATIASLVLKYKDNMVSITRLSCATLSNGVLNDTPVLTGSLSASWTVSNGRPKAKNININKGNPIPTRNEITTVINGLNVGDLYSFANGQPYVRRIEYERWSAKARGGMLRINVARWQSIVAGSI